MEVRGTGFGSAVILVSNYLIFCLIISDTVTLKTNLVTRSNSCWFKPIV